MKASRGLWVPAALFAVLACGFLVNPSVLKAADKGVLTQGDCIKCHESPVADVAAAGGKHKSDVNCLDCHTGHRPTSKNNIPKCSQCHEGKAHYQEKNCMECHKNPHKPLSIAFGTKVTEPCLACHTEQIKQMKEHKSKHAALFCSSCHDVHRKIPECVKCHKPHSPEMAQADCGKCHKAHMPTVLAYGVDVPNKDCGSCHMKALELVSATETKHKSVTCVRCHKDMHKTVPTCEQCHPKTHSAQILKKFTKCGGCHYTAHDLNNWPVGTVVKEKAAPAKTVPKKKR